MVAPAGAPGGVDEGVDDGFEGEGVGAGGCDGGVDDGFDVEGAAEVETSWAAPPHPVIANAHAASRNQRSVFIG